MATLEHPTLADLDAGAPSTSYWEVGGHPNFLLSVDERVLAARERLAQVSDTMLTIFLCGERGVGKEMLARGVHNLSSRRDRAFVSLNAYAVPKAAIRRELFDHGGGGKLASVEDGTLHVHGLELLESDVRRQLVAWKRQRIGDPALEPRLIFSCEQPSLQPEALDALEESWEDAGGAVRVEIPPLRDRREDVPLLANHILKKYGEFYNSRVKVLRGSFVRFLTGYRWPGNTRELERVIRRFLVVEDEEMIREELGSKQGGGSEVVQDMIESGAPMKQILAYTIARVETRAISHALAQSRWNKKRAAAELCISYKSLLNKIKQYAIEA